jgi:DEAD/DEAH box helicase domain-containing protein
VGIAQVGYEQAEQWWTQTRALLLECACLDGCPACVQSPKCGNGNQHLSKRGAAALASLLLSQPVPTRDLGRRLNGATGSTLADESGARSVIADLKGRLERAKAEPSGPRRSALLAALRYRLRVERDALGAEDQLALAAIEAEATRL